MTNILHIAKNYLDKSRIIPVITGAFGFIVGAVGGGVIAVNVFSDAVAGQYAVAFGGLGGLTIGVAAPIGIEVIRQLFPKAQTTTDESTAITQTISPATKAAQKEYPVYGSVFNITPNQETPQLATTQPVDQNIKDLVVPGPGLTRQVE